jgi:lambda family phage portal protein
MAAPTWLERTLRTVAPRWQLQRTRARIATDLLMRNYEGAATGRRTQGWRRSSADANLSTAPYIGKLRDVARDLVRNNPYAESALTTIVDHAVGFGITARPVTNERRVLDLWRSWAESTDCDADGRTDLAGLEKTVLRTVAEAGECLVRRRLRLPADGLPIPLQIQVLEPDFLDTTKHGLTLPNGGRIIYGVEFSPIGERVAYWLYPEHPGNSAFPTGMSRRIPADGVLHVFKPARPGAVRAGSWFAPVLLRFKDFDEYEDATLMKQKIAACLAVITSDVDGTGQSLGTADDSGTPAIDSLEPGAILNVAAGRSVEVVQPPSVTDYPEFTKVTLRAIATGLGVTYEDLTGDYSNMPFSAARMSRIRHWARVDDWRWRLLIPQFCDPVWDWAMTAAAAMNLVSPDYPQARWTPPPMPMIEPDKEGLAYQRLIRNGLQSWSETARERGYDPDELLAEIADDNAAFDALKVSLDSDPRHLTQAGQLQSAKGTATAGTPQDGAQTEGGGA